MFLTLLFRFLLYWTDGLSFPSRVTFGNSVNQAAHEQPWTSCNALDSDQRGPRFEAHCRPLVTSGRASDPKFSCQN